MLIIAVYSTLGLDFPEKMGFLAIFVYSVVFMWIFGLINHLKVGGIVLTLGSENYPPINRVMLGK